MIRVPADSREVGDEEDELADDPGFASTKSRKPVANPFAMVKFIIITLYLESGL